MHKNIQLAHSDHKPSGTRFPLAIIANDIADPLNTGGLFRITDALGIEKLYLCGETPAPPNTKISRTSRSTEKYVDHEYHADAEALVKTLKAAGALAVSLEISSSSIAISSAEFETTIASGRPVCLIVGSENTGVSETLLSLSDLTVHIPMHGYNSSMNLVSAASIACFEITRMMKSGNDPE